MIASIGNESWVETFLEGVPYGRSDLSWFRIAPGNQWSLTPRVKVGLVFVVGCLCVAAIEWRGGDAANSYWWFAVYGAAIIALFVFREK